MAEVNYNFDTTQWINLKQNIKNVAQPDRSVSFCTDYGFCNQDFKYRSYGYGDYSNYYKTNSSTQHTNTHSEYYPQYYKHTNAPSSGYTEYHNYSAYNDSAIGYKQSYHGNYSRTYQGHNNSSGHLNSCGRSYSEYSKTTTSCYDVSSHYNSKDYCYQCSQSYGYNDAVALTTNLPNSPVLLGTESGDIPRLAKVVTLGMFAYDKDYNLSAASTEEKEVYYDLYIQKIQDENGNVLTGQPLTKIITNSKENAIGEGVTFNFDSTSYSDGYYRFIGVARNIHATYRMQDVGNTNITTSGNYNGSDLYSGLVFPPGTRTNSASANSVKLKAGTMQNMVTINKVFIKQNTNAFFSYKNALTSILNFAFANDDALEYAEGRFDETAKIKQIYGQNGIADGDPYISLKGWTSGLVAKIDVEERDVAQYVKVTGTLYRKSDGTIIPGSTVTAQFPINKSSPSSYTEIKAAGGIDTKMEAYLYWPATLFSASNLKNGLEEVEIRLTTYEYENVAGTVLADNPKTSASIETNSNGTEDPTRASFDVDKFSPDITNDASQNTWVASSTVTVNVDDRFLNGAVNGSGTGIGLDRVEVKVVNRITNEILDTYDWTKENGGIPALAKNISKVITIDTPLFHDNIGLDITAWDLVGNIKTQSISNIQIDNTTTNITISPAPVGSWSKSQISPTISFSKPGGAPFSKIQVAETLSPTPPAEGSSEWKVFTSGLGTDYTYNTTTAGRTTNSHYVHILVDDGIHPTIKETYGPYKVDLETPNVTITSTAGNWAYRPTVNIAVTDSAVGSKLKTIKYAWNKTDGSEGGSEVIDLSDSNVNVYNGTYTIEIPENTYENNISCIVEVEDNAGNIFKNTITDLRADKTVPVIAINPNSDLDWHNIKINTITTIVKPAGAPCSTIKIAETNSASRPADLDSAWKDVSISGGGAIYPNQATGQMSGQHYVHVWVEKGTYDLSNPDSKRIDKTFGPYKIDLMLPEMTNSQANAVYAQKNGWYWELPTYDIDVVDNGGSLMKRLQYKIAPTPAFPTVDSSWTNVAPSSTRFSVVFPNGSNYAHVDMEDNAGNKQSRTTPIPIKVDTKNPEKEILRTNIGGVNSEGQVTGFVNLEISANDDISGIKIAKYAITDNPIPPDFSVVGNNNAENLGRTNGWIDFSAYSDIGVSIDIKAPGKSYIYIYAEDNAGRKLNSPSTIAGTEALDVEGIYKYEEDIDIIPVYLSSLEVDTSLDKSVIDENSLSVSTGQQYIYALKNISNITNFNLHYANYQSSAQKTLQFDVIDCQTKEVVRTTRTHISLNVGDSQIDDDVLPYNFPVWWVNGKTGQKLPTGVYEIKASMLNGEDVINSISSFVIIKQNALEQPKIEIVNLGDKADITTKFIKDSFYDDLASYSYDDFVLEFIQDLKNNHPTKYSTTLVDKSGTENKTNHPVPIAAEFSYPTYTTQFVTVVATIEDAFGNVARLSRVVDFFNKNPGLTIEEVDKKNEANKQEAKTLKDNTTSPIKHIETPNADNYIIGGGKPSSDEVNNNPFKFLGKSNTSEDEE